MLDEADEMLDLGFLPDVERLISKTPELRQTMLFSATMRGEVVTLARTHMRHPVNIRAEASDRDRRWCRRRRSSSTRRTTSTSPRSSPASCRPRTAACRIIFTRTKRQAQRVAEDLIDRGFPAAPLHGDMAQVARERALKRFREGKVEILVATDVAARGIDVEGITHVINYTCPEDEKTYVHRIGRTGRAGATGVAITFVDWADVTRWKVINKALDLPFDEPQETYSTSEHLFHDQGIPADAKGRIGKPREKPSADDLLENRGPDRDRRGSGRGHGGSGARGGRGGRPGAGREDGADEKGSSGSSRSRSRSRRRTRGGQSVDGGAPADSSETAPSIGGDSAGSGSSGRRRRSRNRAGSGQQSAPSTD